ncbi:type II toxin -antitoxin system TacA 1-like antitoxin [Entomobacter blattae]|nr:DUF1778 domain-containing protein [Entomobacter blattae]
MNLIDQVARVNGKTRSDFMIEASWAMTEETINR